MKTLQISDLTTSTELDSAAMATVSGGHSKYMPHWGGPSYSSRSTTDVDLTTFTADQFVGQNQNISVATGINSAFADHIRSNVSSNQNAANNINFS